MGKKKSRADKEGTSSLAASMKALYDDMVARAILQAQQRRTRK